MTIRPYREMDRERLQEITALCFEGVSIDRNLESKFGVVNGHDWRWRKGRDIDEDVAANPEGVLVAEAEDATVIGYVTVRLSPQTGIGRIANLAVDPARQKRGIGRQLIEAALDCMRQHGMQVAKIETLEQNAVGQRFYPRLGFVEIARQIHYAMPLGT